MNIIIGFVFGFLASLLASIVITALPKHKQKPITVLITNPLLYLKLRSNTVEREIKNKIDTLFEAWEKRDINIYLSCWADDAVRIMGSTSSLKENKDAIARKFSDSCKKYSVINVICVIFENVTLSQDKENATAHVFYRFSLIRTEDSMPIYEEANEVYSLRKRDGRWQIASNIDHFCDVQYAIQK